MKLGKETLLWTAVSVIGLISVISLFLGVSSPDDVSQNTRPATDFSSILTHWNNFRYFIVLISQPFLKYGIHYNEVMPVWVAVLIIGIITTCYSVLRYANLPMHFLPCFIALVTVHGYFTNIFYYPMSYSVFGFGFLFTGLALLCLTRFGVAWSLLSGMFVALALLSYQPAALVILFAASLSCINNSIQQKLAPSQVLKDAIRAPIAFIIGCVIFLVCVKLISDGNGRAISPSYFTANIPPYLSALKKILFGLNVVDNIYPVIQRILFFSLNIFVLAIIILNGKKVSIGTTLLALAAYVSAILIFPSPLNLFSDIFWPSPRSISALVFFELGLLFILLSKYGYLISKNAKIGAFIIFVAVSGIHQMKVYAGAKAQNLVDQFAARQILDQINAIAPITADTKIAVISSWKNGIVMNPYISMDNGQSAFDTTWSNNSILWLSSPVKYIRVAAPQEACKADKSPKFWAIERIGDLIVVCMR